MARGSAVITERSIWIVGAAQLVLSVLYGALTLGG